MFNCTDSYWSMFDNKIGGVLYLGDVRKCLQLMPARSVHSIVTSPPYWGLRDYGFCECIVLKSTTSHSNSTLNSGGNFEMGKQKEPDPNCKVCNGTGRTLDKSLQIGLESSPDCMTYGQKQCGDCFVCSMISVFRELHRVLRDDGVAWLNLGDTYDGNLFGVPWRVALALQQDGWILRSDVIWAKPNPMPESVEDRCTKSHEHIFMLTKSLDYYYDRDAIAEEATPVILKSTSKMCSNRYEIGNGNKPAREIGEIWATGDTRNKRDVWFVSTKPGLADSHYATFSPELITPCILAATSEHGCCASCAKPWERVVIKTGGENANNGTPSRDRSLPRNRQGLNSTLDGVIPQRHTVGWRKVCGCDTDEVNPCIVLDPFVGSGTTVATAVNLSRCGIGIDVNENYLKEHAIPRVESAVTCKPIKRPTKPLQKGTRPAARKFR